MDLISANQYVEWFHQKYISFYSPNCWPTAKMDHRALINIIQEFGVQSILEFGTYQGWTTLLMWLHPNIKRMTTVDIHKDLGVEYEHVTHHLRDKSFYGEYFKFCPVKQIFQDSKTIETLDEQFDMVFVEANHAYEYVKHDSELAYTVNPKVVVWHDVDNEPGVKKYLSEIEGVIKIGEESLVGYKTFVKV